MKVPSSVSASWVVTWKYQREPGGPWYLDPLGCNRSWAWNPSTQESWGSQNHLAATCLVCWWARSLSAVKSECLLSLVQGSQPLAPCQGKGKCRCCSVALIHVCQAGPCSCALTYSTVVLHSREQLFPQQERHVLHVPREGGGMPSSYTHVMLWSSIPLLVHVLCFGKCRTVEMFDIWDEGWLWEDWWDLRLPGTGCLGKTWWVGERGAPGSLHCAYRQSVWQGALGHTNWISYELVCSKLWVHLNVPKIYWACQWRSLRNAS